jgi:hypothetical protein
MTSAADIEHIIADAEALLSAAGTELNPALADQLRSRGQMRLLGAVLREIAGLRRELAQSGGNNA